jgi:hypothetical protein
MCSMDKNEDYCFTKSLGGLNENVWIVSIQIRSSLVSNVENVHHVQFDNVLNIDVLQLVSIETQVTTWKPHSQLFIYWRFFITNDGLLAMDFVNPQVLQCIICKYE